VDIRLLLENILTEGWRTFLLSRRKEDQGPILTVPSVVPPTLIRLPVTPPVVRRQSHPLIVMVLPLVLRPASDPDPMLKFAGFVGTFAAMNTEYR
jgi:hypothetical protein